MEWHLQQLSSKASRALNRSLVGRTCTLASERTWKQLYSPCALFDNQGMGCWVIVCTFESETERFSVKFEHRFSQVLLLMYDQNEGFSVDWYVCLWYIPGRLLRSKTLATALDRTCSPLPECLLQFYCHSKQRWQVICIWLVCCGCCFLSAMLERTQVREVLDEPSCKFQDLLSKYPSPLWLHPFHTAMYLAFSNKNNLCPSVLAHDQF